MSRDNPVTGVAGIFTVSPKELCSPGVLGTNLELSFLSGKAIRVFEVIDYKCDVRSGHVTLTCKDAMLVGGVKSDMKLTIDIDPRETCQAPEPYKPENSPVISDAAMSDFYKSKVESSVNMCSETGAAESLIDMHVKLNHTLKNCKMTPSTLQACKDAFCDSVDSLPYVHDVYPNDKVDSPIRIVLNLDNVFPADDASNTADFIALLSRMWQEQLEKGVRYQKSQDAQAAKDAAQATKDDFTRKLDQINTILHSIHRHALDTYKAIALNKICTHYVVDTTIEIPSMMPFNLRIDPYGVQFGFRNPRFLHLPNPNFWLPTTAMQALSHPLSYDDMADITYVLRTLQKIQPGHISAAILNAASRELTRSTEK